MLTERIQILCKEQGITFAKLERAVDLSNGQIRKWDSVSPKTSNLILVAKYFNVSLDFLTGLSVKIEKVKEESTFESSIYKLNKLTKKLGRTEVDEVIRFAEYLKLKRNTKE